MKKDFIKIIGVFIVVILQLTIFSKISIFESIPNLIIILSVALVIRGLLRDSLLVAIAGGLLLDIASPLRFGLYTILTIVIILFIHYVVLKNIPAPNQLLIFIFYMAIFLVINLIIAAIIGAIPYWQMLIDSIVNGLWGIVVYLILAKIIQSKEEYKFV